RIDACIATVGEHGSVTEPAARESDGPEDHPGHHGGIMPERGRRCNVSAVNRWQRYWFSDGGRTSLAIVRIAVAASVLLTLVRLDDVFSAGDLPTSSALYRPVGIWMALGDRPPP